MVRQPFSELLQKATKETKILHPETDYTLLTKETKIPSVQSFWPNLCFLRYLL